ncbi:MAG TPA: DUF3293 domain-containing protein [Thermoanaerobaculia bacterium]|nr:DUF3293 domain-containing protein [Thermoanaerobaculia bacterium]
MSSAGPPLDAYRRAIYRVDAPEGSFDLAIGQRSDRLEALLAARGAGCWGFLTAVHPGSVRLPEEQNRERTARLRARIEASGREWLPGRGLDPDGEWPEEPSFLVLGADEEEIAALGLELGQAAVVVGLAAEPARLRVLATQEPLRRGDSRASATVKAPSPTGRPSTSSSTE